MKLSNLLPRDPRVVELCSAGALILSGLSILLGGELSEIMKQVRPSQFWGAFLLYIGVIQLWALAWHPKFELSRIAIALVAGAFWVWMGMADLLIHNHADDWGALFLGVGNLYSFMVGFLYQRSKWLK